MKICDANAVRDMPYADFVGLVRETNRCPGGKATINQIARLLGLHAGSRILEVGCSTGFTSLELASITESRVLGIDRAERAIAEAQRIRSLYPEEIAERVTFEVRELADAAGALEPFDLVIVGGATSFMENKREAVAQYRSLIRPYGFLAAANLFYHSPPPSDLVREVSATIGVTIEPHDSTAWVKLFASSRLEIYHVETHHLVPRSNADIVRYVDLMMQQPHLEMLRSDVRHAVQDRWQTTMTVFNRNHAYLGYVVLIARNAIVDEQPELFYPVGTFDRFMLR